MLIIFVCLYQFVDKFLFFRFIKISLQEIALVTQFFIAEFDFFFYLIAINKL